jgi:hypothetical protein
LTEIELSREYDDEKWPNIDERLGQIEQRVGKVAPANMAQTNENALSGCMEKVIDQLMDRVMKRFQDAADANRKKSKIRRGKQGEVFPADGVMSGIEFKPDATFVQLIGSTDITMPRTMM